MYFCYQCNNYTQPTANMLCAACNSDFIEEMDNDEAVAMEESIPPFMQPPQPQSQLPSQPRRIIVQSFNSRGGNPMVFPSFMPAINPFAQPMQIDQFNNNNNNANINIRTSVFPFFPSPQHSPLTAQNFPSRPNDTTLPPNQPMDFGQLLSQIATVINTDIQNNQNQNMPNMPSHPNRPLMFPFPFFDQMFGGGGVFNTNELFTENMEHILNHLFETARFSGPPPASKEAISGIPKITITEQQQIADLGDACAVCKDDFEIGQEALQLPCNHSYHPDCILQWLESKNTCPVCRYELPTDDPEYEQKRLKKQQEEEARRRNVEANESSSTPSTTSTTSTTPSTTTSAPCQET